MTEPAESSSQPSDLAEALYALRDQIFLAIDETGTHGYVELERLQEIRDAATDVDRLGSMVWIRRRGERRSTA